MIQSLATESNIYQEKYNGNLLGATKLTLLENNQVMKELNFYLKNSDIT